jgi:nitrogen fixation protein NifB
VSQPRSHPTSLPVHPGSPRTRLGGFEHLQRRHPCLSGPASTRFGRVHLPVAPGCNIGCRFCARSLTDTAQRPGVARGLVRPQDAVALVERALELCPDITVVGVAGPGDALATPHALEALAAVHARFPALLACMSTNGLRLPEKVDEVVAAGVSTLTVTVNAVDPLVLERLCAYVIHGGRRLTGREAARVLVDAQLEGIALAAARGLLVKVNCVLVPEVNDDHVEEVARAVAAAGARLMNLIPLIPQHQLADRRAPRCDELEDAREDVERHLEVFRHCQHCRADACGIPGQGPDLGKQLFAQPAPETFSHG